MKKSLAALALLSGLPLSAYAQQNDGPFGFKVGDDIAAYQACVVEDADGMYRCSPAPKPHPDFPDVTVWHMKGVGICMVSAVTPLKTTSVQGYELMRATDAIADQVAVNYGKPKKYDFLHAGSIWGRAQEWTQAMQRRERTYSFIWPTVTKNGVKEITVAAYAISGGEIFVTNGFVRVEFRLRNMEDCRAALKKQRASSF